MPWLDVRDGAEAGDASSAPYDLDPVRGQGAFCRAEKEEGCVTRGENEGLELLQITLVVADLDRIERDLAEAYGLEVAFRDPGVDLWGLDNIVLPMGRTFIEVLRPKRADTPGGRHLARQGGDGGYMVILKTGDLAPWRERLARLGVRIAFEAETQDEQHGQHWAGLHLHPRDTGGMMISIDRPDPPDSWAGAGPDWRAHVRQGVVDGLAGVVLESPDPAKLAARWGEVLGRAPWGGPGGALTIELDHGTLDFVTSEGRDFEGLSAVRLHASDRSRVGEHRRIGGVDFRLV